MRVLVFGGSGQLGSEIVRRWRDCDVLAPSSAQANVEDAEAVERVFDDARPDAVVNCTAFHNVDVCEREPGRAFAVNAVAIDRLARLCRDRDAIFATISTDYVFDGSASRPYAETDVPQPINTYGVSKRAGELLVERLRSRAFVVRTCGLYGVGVSSSKGYTFVDRILNQARVGDEIRVVDDVVASPTYAAHLADALRRLLETRAFGLYHAANTGAVSWCDFAREALRAAGIAHPVTPIRAADWKPETRRPAYSALSSEKLASLAIAMPTWQDGIRAYLHDKSISPSR